MSSNETNGLTGLAVDLGGTATKIGIVDSEGAILAQREIKSQSYEGPDRMLERIGEAASQLRDEANSNPAGLGMGVPGLIDLQEGVVKFCPNLEGNWRGVPVRELLEKQLQCPVRLLNDVRIATLGELTFGHGKGQRETMIFFSLGTGIRPSTSTPLRAPRPSAARRCPSGCGPVALSKWVTPGSRPRGWP